MYLKQLEVTKEGSTMSTRSRAFHDLNDDMKAKHSRVDFKNDVIVM